MTKTTLKKFVYFLLLTLLNYGISSAQLISEGFESGSFPASWSNNSAYVNSGSANTGSYKAGMNSVNDWIRTSQETNPGILTFYCRASGSTSNYTVTVQYSTDDVTYTDAATFSANGSNSGDVTDSYSQKTVTLDLTGNYYIRWYMTSRSGGSFYMDDVVLNALATTPTPVSNFIIKQFTSDQMNITWTKPSGTYGSAWDGVVVFARQGSANDATVASTDGIDFTANLTYGSGTLNGNSYCVARQTTDADGDIVVTGLTTGSTYYFIAYTYKEVSGDNNDDTWSDASSEINNIANIEEVSSFSLVPDNTQVGLSWTNPTGTITDYWDQVIILAKSGSAVDATPSGDPSLYSANAAFASGTQIGVGNYVVYKGTGTSETVTSLTNGTDYYFKAFVYYLDNGSAYDYSSGTSSSATPNSIIAEPSSGELVITEVNSTSSANATYIELYNNTASIIRLDSVSLEHYNNGSATPSDVFALSGNLDSYSFAIATRSTSTFESVYSSVTADFQFANMYLNGGTDGVAIKTNNNGIIDQFNDVPGATNSWTDNHLFYRIYTDSTGSDINVHWVDVGSNETGTPKASNPYIWLTEGTTNWAATSNWNSNMVPGSSNDVLIQSGTNQPVIASAEETNALRILSGASLDISPDYSLTVNGALNVEGSLTINSDATGMGSIITLDTVIGNSTFEIYTTQNVWWYTSPVVESATSNIYNASSNSLYWYDEPGQAWTQITNNSTNLNTCQGYAYKNASANDTLSFVGVLNTGNQSIALTSNSGTYQGYNLVGNPYPSAIDWQSGAITMTNMDNKLWYRSGGNFATWNGLSTSGTNGGQQYIPAGQGFWVKATAAGTFGVTNSARVHNTQNFYKENSNPKLSILAMNNNYSDETILLFMEGSDNGFDPYDTEKMFSTVDEIPQVWFAVDNEDLALNVLPEIDINSVFPLGFKASVSGYYSFKVNELENFPSSVEIILEDMQTNTWLSLKKGDTYEFYSDIVDNLNRFFIHVSESANISHENLLLNDNIYSYENRIFVQNIENATIEVYDMLGAKIFEQRIGKQERNSFTITSQTGYYLVKVLTKSKVITKKVFIN